MTWALHADKVGGLDFESEVNSPTNPSAANPAVTSNRHYLSAGGQVIGVLVTTGALPTLAANDTAPPVLASTTAVKVEYWHKDHLGSTAATTDHASALTARYAYDPFGKRRATNGSYDAAGAIVVDWSPAVNNGNDRGFTGHEHLDDVGLVHMNGRVFDPRLGVFLQADPLTQDPYNLQGFNRYGYCLNNPLTCTDPSGLFNLQRFTFGVFNFAPMALKEMAHSKVGYQIGSIAISVISYYYCGGAAAACNAAGQAAWAAWAGYSAEQSAQIGAFAAISTVINGQIGDALPIDPDKGGTFWTTAGNTVAHGAWGCAQSRMGGGDCGSGFRGGLAGAALSNSGVGGFGGSDPDVYDVVVNTMIHSTIGGIAATAGGGSFADGAQTAAFAYLFNFCAHNGCFNRPFRLVDAYDQWKNGNGSTVTDVAANELNRSDATWTQSTKDPKTWYVSLRMKFESGPIYGTISGRLGENGFVTLNPDFYDFDVKELQGRSFGGDLAIVKRDFLNAISATIHGAGTPFQIQFNGSVKAPEWVYDKTFGTAP